ncbi:MAG: ParB/RepB/Spo0J family partition protein [Sphingomonadaceae bacterium]|nr:ParB/RepB/Spo0J family partition protein [Sphingomonadaceae bacterium]
MSDTTDPIRFSVPARSQADKKKKLGKGLGALLGETRREEPLVRREGPAITDMNAETGAPSARTAPQSGLAQLSVAAIEPLPGQPRKYFDEEALAELAASIEQRGVIQPVIVRPLAGGRYQLVAGERRWRAAQKARLHEIPALIRDLSEREVMALALIENIQREDLNPVEEARAYHRLSEDEGLTQAEIAKMVDKSRSHVANFQRLLALPDAVLDHVERGDLSMGHARALIGHDDAVEIANRAVKQKLSVREVEKLARAGATPAPRKTARSASQSAEDADIAAVQAHLEEFLGLQVRIKSDADPRSGQVTIRYRTLDQLDLICQRLTGGDI